MPAGFISEMTALPVHGGGVTMARILGDDLGRFDWFAETLRHPHETEPSYDGALSHSFPVGTLQRRMSPIVGCSWAYRIASHPLSRRIFAKRVATGLLRREPKLGGSRILVCPQADISLMVMEELRRRVPVKYVSWMMDDHLVRWQDGGWRYPDGFEEIMGRHLSEAEMVFSISPAMRDFYRERFGVDSQVLCGPATAVASIESRIAGDGRVRLAYFGSLGRWQNDALALLAAELAAGRATLDVFTRNPQDLPQELMDVGAVTRSGIPAEEVLATAAHYDALVLPISFRPELRNMSYFNVATKFSECLASAVPTLLIGPPDSAMVGIARSANACAVVDQLSGGEIKAAIDRLRSPIERRKIVEAEHALLASDFSPAIMRRRWEPAKRFLFPADGNG